MVRLKTTIFTLAGLGALVSTISMVGCGGGSTPDTTEPEPGPVEPTPASKIESTPSTDDQPRDQATGQATTVADDMSTTLLEWSAYECSERYSIYRACIIEKAPDTDARATALAILNATVSQWSEHMDAGDEGMALVDESCMIAAQDWKKVADAMGCETWTVEPISDPKIDPATGFPELRTGISECDEPFNKHVRCRLGAIDEGARQAEYRQFETNAKGMRTSARDPEQRDAWAQDCSANGGSFREAALVIGCTW